MSSIENMIAWMQARKGKVTYSMTSRMGQKVMTAARQYSLQ
ncbi:hypothetical protein N42HA_01175 [Lactococcus lactis]|nr:hypothetical protein [Lactococcus lactis]